MTGVGRELSGQGNCSLYICDQSPLLCIMAIFFRKSGLTPKSVFMGLRGRHLLRL